MRTSFVVIAACTAVLWAANQASAIELLAGGHFETRIPNWALEESLASGGFVDAAEGVDNFAPIEGTKDLWLKGFAGGRPLRVEEGNFDLDNLPAGDVDGNDFLVWQRGGSPVPVSAADLTAWKANFGALAGGLANAALSQTVPATAGETYIFKGQSRWESNYSGGVTTLGSFGPLGEVPSPTTTKLEMAFLNASGAVIGAPVSLDLKADGQSNIDFWLEHDLPPTVAPPGTTHVRVTARADNMVWNDLDDALGDKQSAFFDDFSLERASAPGVEILANPGLETAFVSELDLWTVTQVDPDPNGPGTIVEPPGGDPTKYEVVRTAGFANHTTGGSSGIWLSPFHGNIAAPVDGIISQTVAGVAGGLYSFSGWSKWEGSYSGGVDTITNSPAASDVGKPSPTDTLMEIAFLDSMGGVIGSQTLDLRVDRAAQIGSAIVNDSSWRQHFINAVAPAGTASVRVSASMLDGVFNGPGGQSAFFDDFSLNFAPPGVVSIPEPSSLVCLLTGLAAWRLGRSRRQASR